MPDPEALERGLTLAVVLTVCLATWLAALARTAAPTTEVRVRRVPSEEEIAAGVRRLALEGGLPPGWSRRDAERLVRVRARRADGQTGDSVR